MYIVTGGAGFIGSNLIEALNKRAIDDILLVDNLTDASKLPNINDLEIADYLDQNAFVDRINHEGCLPADVQAVFHLGACSDTMEQDGKYMMANNYQYSRRLYQWCAANNIPFIYASSAAVYGASSVFREQRKYEKPLNIYGYSKFLFDQYVRRNPAKSQVVGLRYFNVYGPREAHKGRMASVAFHHFHQLHKQGYVELFVGSHGYAQGEQKRDFVYVGDVVAAKLHFLDNPQTSGIFNLGTGQAQSFNQLALAGVNAWRNDSPLELANAVDDGFIRYVPFPEGLADRYQAFTQADINALRASGFSQSFLNVNEAVCEYYSWLAKKYATSYCFDF